MHIQKKPGKFRKPYPVMLMDEARKELFAMDAENRAAFISAIDDFELYGPGHKRVDTEKISGDLFELKTQSASHWLRGFYFHYLNGLYVVSHIFAKKTNKAPKSNRELGLARYMAFIDRMKKLSDT